ncbi:MAG: GTP-binding protein [Bryobacteraceae bacterium]
MDKRPLLVLVGGFLGAGKTRLLLRAAEILGSRGLKSAIITNDQAEGLVDTSISARTVERVEEVSGGCFCCRFDAFASAVERLRGHNPDAIFAEPVGSCTDLVATVLRPFRDFYGSGFSLAPLSVLVDPSRVDEILMGDSDVAYLFRKQLEEADLVCFTRADLGIPPRPLAARKPERFLSAKTGEGVTAWLDEISSGHLAAGGSSIELDYSRYARAEAALGWLNASFELELETWVPPIAVVGPLMDEIDRKLSESGARIAHLKLIDETPFGFLKAATCRIGEEPEIEGDLLSPPSSRHNMILNVRAQTDPAVLRKVVEAALAQMPAPVNISALSAFRPAPPKPMYRSA